MSPVECGFINTILSFIKVYRNDSIITVLGGLISVIFSYWISVITSRKTWMCEKKYHST